MTPARSSGGTLGDSSEAPEGSTDEPKEARHPSGGPAEARRRLRIAEQYLFLAEMLADDDAEGAINACIGTCVLAGIAAADSLCYSRLGERYAGPDHEQAADLLDRVDKTLGRTLRILVALKTKSQYGDQWLTDGARKSAIRVAGALVRAASATL